jgi:hypothetical protein
MDSLVEESQSSSSDVAKSDANTEIPPSSQPETGESDSERIELPEGETDHIVIFEPPPPGHDKQPLRLLLMKVDPKESYAHFKIRINRDRLDTSDAVLTCWHEFKSEDKGPFESLAVDCTGLDEYIVDQLEPGFHKFYVELEGSKKASFRSPPVNFKIQERGTKE